MSNVEDDMNLPLIYNPDQKVTVNERPLKATKDSSIVMFKPGLRCLNVPNLTDLPEEIFQRD